MDHSDSNSVECSLWECQVANALTTSDTFTITTLNSVNAKSIAAVQFTLDNGSSLGAPSAGWNAGSGVTSTITVSGLPTAKYLYFGVTGIGTSLAITTEDADFSYTTGIGTGGSPASSNVVANGAYAVLNSSGGTTFDTDWGFSPGTNWCVVMGAMAVQ